tara:strand:- start:16023 stop:20705 length:4683 start_codon:yes stop_codon:yes gene_type:complete
MAAPLNINANLNLNPASINASAKQVQQALGRITGQASEFQKSLDASTARVFAFGATTAVINGVTQSFKALISTTITVQSKLVEINSILGAGAQEFNKYRNSIFQVAKVTGQSFETVAEGAAELARQGLSATESAKRLKAALILTRISGLGAEQSVKALTAAMNGFTSAGLTAEQVVNKIVAVDTAFAVSAQDLADGFSRAGSTAEDAGVSFDQLLGLITAVEQRTARGGAVIGNAFKSIFTRLSRGTTIEDLQELGVAIDANQNGVQKLQALSKALENITDPTVASQIKELAGGVFQINVVSAALKDIGSEASVFGQATAKSFGATNEATSKNIALNEQLAAQINSLVVSVTSLGAKIGGITFGPLLQNLVGLATKLSEMLDGALDPEKGNKFIQGLFKFIGGFLSGPGLALFTVAFAKIFGTVFKFAKEGFKTVMQMGSATERIKNIEGGIVGLLQKDANLRKTLASTTATQAQKEQAIISAIQKENMLLTQQEQLVRSIARQAAARGVTGFSGAGGFAGKKGKRFAAGGGGEMEPNLMSAMMNEARDAPRGATPYVTNFRGKPAVMNTSEMQVRINGREEILRQDQIPRFNKGSGLARKQRRSALNRDGQFIMMHGERTGYKLNRFFMGVDPRGGATKATKGPTETNKTLVNVPTYGIPRSKKGIGDINTIVEKLRNTSLDEAIRVARAISNNKMPNKKKSAIRGAISSQINKGTVRAFAGNIQELGLGSLLTDDQFNDYVSQGTGSTFDLNLSGQKALKGFYNVRRHRATTGEVKGSGNDALAADTARKIFRVSNMGAAIHSSRNKQGLASGSDFKKNYPSGVRLLGKKGKPVGPVIKSLPTINKGLGMTSGSNASKSQIDQKFVRMSKGSLPNLKIKRYNEGSMGGIGIDPMMLMMLGMGGMGGTLGGGKDEEVGDESKSKQKRFDLDQGLKGRDSAPKKTFMQRHMPTFQRMGRRTAETTRNAGSRVANSRFGQNRFVRGAVKPLTNRTPSMRGGMGLTIAGQAMTALAPSAGSKVSEFTGSQKAGDITESFGSATGSITQFAAAGAMVAGPLGAAAGAAVGYGKALLDAKKIQEEATKVAQEAAKVSPEMEGKNRAMALKREFVGDASGGMNVGNKNIQKVLSNLAKETGVAALDTSQQLEQLGKALASTKEGSTERLRVEEEFKKLATKTGMLMKNSLGIQKTLNKIKKKELLIDQERKNNIAARLGDDISKQRQRLEVGQRLMEGNPATQGPLANLLSRDLGMSKAIGDTGQAKALVQELEADLAGATTQGEKDSIQKELDQASADFKSTVVESAIFMHKKQMESASELTKAEAERAKIIAARDKMRSGQQISDMAKAGRGEVTDLSFIETFRVELDRIRSRFNTSTQAEKNADIARLSAFAEENISKIQNPGRQEFVRGLTTADFNKNEREAVSKLSVTGASDNIMKGFIEAATKDAEAKFDAQLAENERLIAALKVQGKNIEKQMAAYALAFDAEKIQEGINKTSKKLEEAATSLDGYVKASEEIGGISANIIKLGQTANKAIDDQTTRLEGFSQDITTLKADVKQLTSP